MTAKITQVARLKVVGQGKGAAPIRLTDALCRLPEITCTQVEGLFMTSAEIRMSGLQAA